MRFKIKRDKLPFYFSYFLWVVGNAFLVNLGSLVDDYVKMAALIIMILSVFLQQWTRKEVHWYFLFFAFCIGTFYFNHETDVIVLAILVTASRKINIYNLAKFDVPIRFSCLIITIVCYYLGIVEGYNMIDSEAFLEVRLSLGYTHPNNLFSQIFILVVGILLANHERLKLRHYSLLILFEIFCGIITYSRTGMIVLAILIILTMLRNTKMVNNHIFIFAAKYSFPICGILIMLAIGMYKNGNMFVNAMDALVSGRIRFAYRIIDNYGINLVGQQIEYIGAADAVKQGVTAIVLDSMYPYLLVSYGIVFTIVFIGLVMIAQKVLVANDEKVLLIIIVCYSIYSLTQRAFYSVNNNYTILILSLGIDYIVNFKYTSKGQWLYPQIFSGFKEKSSLLSECR